MNNRSSIILIALLGLLISCNEPNIIETTPRPVTPHPSTSVSIQLAVGNTYIWRYTRFYNNGSFSSWQQTLRIVADSVIAGSHYFVFNSGEKLRALPDTIASFISGSPAIWYRFDVQAGDRVPFLGDQMVVTLVDSAVVFGDTVKVISVQADSGSHGAFDTGSYAAKFGLVSLRSSDSTSVTLGSLIGAVLDSTTFDLPGPAK
jgi:hypothetical protein